MAEQPIVNISTDILIEKCRKKNTDRKQLIDYLKAENDKLIHPTFQYRKFMYYFTDYLTVYNDGESFIGNIRPSYKDFLINLCNSLNLKVESKIKTEEELTKLLEERLEVLKNIRTFDQLFENFEGIYRDYINGINYLDRVHKKAKEYPEKKDYYRKLEEYYYRCALMGKPPEFINLQVKLYDGFIHHREEFKQNIEKKNYNDFINKYFDQDKVAMYIVYEYLKCCEKTQNLDKIEKYLKLIEKYEKSSYKKDVIVKISSDIILTQDSIKESIEKQKNRLKHRTITVDWEILPPGRDEKVHSSEDAKERRTIMNQESFDRLTALGRNKNDFYDNTPYYIIGLGKKEFKGYIAFIYLNGEVLLYRRYQTNKTSTATGNATFNLKLADFKTLTKLEKKILKQNPNIVVIRHRDNWKNKVLEIVNRPVTEESEEEVKQLLK